MDWHCATPMPVRHAGFGVIYGGADGHDGPIDLADPGTFDGFDGPLSTGTDLAGGAGHVNLDLSAELM
jgi:hypothetical protein